MTLSYVEIRTDQGVLLPLPLDDVSEGFSVQDITGLDPVQVSIVSSSFAGLDGEQFQSARREKRNIVFRIGLEPDYTTHTVQELRNRLYHFLLPKKSVNMRYYSDVFPTVDIVGRVESFSCPLFSKDPVATASIICFDPDFYEPIQTTIEGSTTPTSSMGEVEYTGTVDTGIVFRLLVDRALTDFTIYHQPEGEPVQTLQVSGSFISGDILEISTVPGNKYATRTRGGIQMSIVHAVSPYATWTKLQTGTNLLRVHAEGAGIPYTIRYTNKHGGL